MTLSLTLWMTCTGVSLLCGMDFQHSCPVPTTLTEAQMLPTGSSPRFHDLDMPVNSSDGIVLAHCESPREYQDLRLLTPGFLQLFSAGLTDDSNDFAMILAQNVNGAGREPMVAMLL